MCYIIHYLKIVDILHYLENMYVLQNWHCIRLRTLYMFYRNSLLNSFELYQCSLNHT